MIKKSFAIILSLFLLIFSFSSCATKTSKYVNGDIVVLYTANVHCALDNDLGYASLAKYKNTIKETNPNVTLVDLGNAITGDSVGSVSNGEYVIDIMNSVGYDYAVIGSHDYDYGMTGLSNLIAKSKFAYLGCNIDFTGDKDEKNGLDKVKPYTIVRYGSTPVAYIGLGAVKDILKSTPRYFMNSKGRRIYDFISGLNLYQRVQKYVDEARQKGAKYVIVLSALGTDDEDVPNRSFDIIHNTTGIDAVLDGRSHKEIENQKIFNKAGKEVIYSQAGSKFSCIGRLNIDIQNDKISTQLIKSIRGNKDFQTLSVIKEIRSSFEKEMKKTIGSSEVDLIVEDSSGKKLVRSREMPIGNFCADAYRAISGADVAFVNGGGIRSNIKKGDITRDELKKVHPFGNKLCVIETKGQNILDALELSASTLSVDSLGVAGNSGGFLQVSGLSFSIDLTLPSTVVLDKSGYFVSASSDDRRVRDVAVVNKKTGEWEYLEPDKRYTLVSTNYMIKDAGDGYSMFRKDNLILDEFTEDSQAISTYILGFLNGKISAEDYGAAQGRINIIQSY